MRAPEERLLESCYSRWSRHYVTLWYHFIEVYQGLYYQHNKYARWHDVCTISYHNNY